MQVSWEPARGPSVDFHQHTRDQYRLKKIKGIGGSDVELQMEKAPFQDGESLIDQLFDPREMTLEVFLLGNTETLYELRRMFAASFNPKYGLGVLKVVEPNGDEYLIDAVSDGAPKFSEDAEQGNIYLKTTIDLMAPNPYWRSPNIEEEPTFEPLFEFAFEGEFEMGLQRDARVIDNDGDAPSPLQIEFYGPAENPRIDNMTTDEFIKVNQTLDEDEYMRIDTTPGQKSVVFVSADGSERNVFNWIDLESTFFQLAIGENELEYSADNDIQGARVDMFWQKKYVGV
ncbi:phage distal tail protein [Alkalicoccus chagannorensis]|uniref:phage distal tail protein n=1 Tax=Alkalicoccus chagannorensis TaxID=427072 RepID=UPI000415BC74|nr:phage tail domain-containing protein [Alkalicoccus chagannorensis]